MTVGDIYSVAGDGTRGFSGDGGAATGAELKEPFATATDGRGNLVIADTGNRVTRVVAESAGTFYGQQMTAGAIYTVDGNARSRSSGDGGPAARAVFSLPDGVALDAHGNVVISDTQSNQIRIAAAVTGTFYGVRMTRGDVYTVAGTGRGGFSGDGGPAIHASLFSPWYLALDAAGNIVIPDTSNLRIRVVAARDGTFYGIRMTVGHIYTVAGDGIAGSAGDGGPATKARVSVPEGVALDHVGNLVISASGDGRIRVVAVRDGTFYGQKMTAGDIYTVLASLQFPQQVAVDSAGNLVVADDHGEQVDVVAVTAGTFYGVPMTAGHVYRVAGNGIEGFSGDGGPAVRAKLNAPDGVAVDPAGNLVIGDSLIDRIRVVASSTGTFYGIPMTTGDIYTIAGTGRPGFSGDGGPARKAMVGPEGVTVTSQGNVFFADLLSGRIRELSYG
jgi:sugar lactone lactonase YvrE